MKAAASETSDVKVTTAVDPERTDTTEQKTEVQNILQTFIFYFNYFFPQNIDSPKSPPHETTETKMTETSSTASTAGRSTTETTDSKDHDSR